MGYEERDAAVVSALHVENSNNRVVPLLWDFSLASDESDKSAELQEDGSVLLNSDFQQFWTRIAVQPPLRSYLFVTAFIGVATSSSVGSVSRELATSYCGSLFKILGSSLSDFAFSSE